MIEDNDEFPWDFPLLILKSTSNFAHLYAFIVFGLYNYVVAYIYDLKIKVLSLRRVK